MTVFLLLAFVPETGIILAAGGIRPMASAVDQASLQTQARLQGN